MKVKVPNGFTGVSHGLNFNNGVSVEFDDEELCGRMVRKGYVRLEEKTPKEKLIDQCEALGIDVKEFNTIEKMKAAIEEVEGAQ